MSTTTLSRKGGEHMNFRSLFSKIFGKENTYNDAVMARLLNDYNNSFVAWNGDAYSDATVRDCVDTVARHFGKLKARHITRKNGNVVQTVDSDINYLLGTKPNPLMTASEFLEKIIAQYFTTNNAFIYPQYDGKGKLMAMWPLTYSQIELLEYRNELYCRFTFGIGVRTTIPYSDIIHIRRHFNQSDLFGDDNSQTMRDDLNMLKAVKTSIINAVANFGALRGILKWKQTLRPEDQQKAWKEFVDTYASGNNGSGIGSLDNKADFQQINTTITTFDSAQMSYARDTIYKHFGLNENIIMGKYTEDEFIAFFESVIEPIAVKLSQELTEKLFTPRERGFGNEVIIESNRLSYMSVASKIKVCQSLIPIGCISINEVREMFGYGYVEGGDERQISLNYVNATDQSKYQVGEDKKPIDVSDNDDADNDTVKGGETDEPKTNGTNARRRNKKRARRKYGR